MRTVFIVIVTSLFATSQAATVLNMTFDNDTPPTVVDNSGQNNNGTLSGPDPSTTDCFEGGCYDFNGTAEYIEVADSASLDITSGITISAWVQAIGQDEYPASTYLEVISKAGAYLLYIRQDGTILFYLTGVQNWVSAQANDHTLFDGAWHHIAATYNGSTLAIYIDGKLNSSTAGSGNITASANVLRIGNTFRGKIDEVRIQNAAVDAAGALALWQSYGTLRTTPQSYYVSSSGSDANDGLSTGAPWATMAKVYSQQFRPYTYIPGDSILLKRGDTWEGTLGTLYLNGTEAAPIVFGAYGTGNAPKIYGDGRGRTWAAVSGYTGVYETVVGAGSKISWVFEGTNHFGPSPNYTPAANWKTLAQTNWAFPFGMSDRIWVRTIDDVAPSDMTVFRNAINLYRSTYVQIQDIDVESVYMGRIQNCASITITNCTSKYSAFSGAYFITTTNCLLDTCTIDGVGDTGIYLLTGFSNVVRNCVVTGVSTNINGFPGGGTDRAGIGLYRGNANLIEHCRFYNPLTNIMSAAMDVFYENDAVFRYNYAEGTGGWFLHGNNNTVYGCILDGQNRGNAGGAAAAPADHLSNNTWGKTGMATNNYILQSTFWDTHSGVTLYPGGVLRNNIFYGNEALLTHRQAGGVFGESDYNCFYSLPPYTAAPRFVIWENWPSGDQVLYQSFASYKSASGQDANSVYGDPLFVAESPAVALDMRIQAGSPARGAGTALGITTDYFGLSYSNPPSIGASEYYSSTGVLTIGTLNAANLQ